METMTTYLLFLAVLNIFFQWTKVFRRYTDKWYEEQIKDYHRERNIYAQPRPRRFPPDTTPR